ncbi:hypothetical protein LH460_09285 [Laribacter hongkongensis]|uniref:hypothetical protein n=1 Tax=Laribacter hongkongensis TaxID=168471 RepID=UPI001EFCF524|nr:hypothetical protein [Laribacter hongkongensis]MCG9124864.1 hypothetical protein [Laribacter hongkongensis]
MLKAKLTPELTVEEACHLRVYGPDEHIPRMEHFVDDVRELRHAGLGTCGPLGEIPEGIVLIDPKTFIRRFPELADAVPVMLAHEGVQPYTDELPRVFKTGAPTPESRPRPTHLSIVPKPTE